MTVHEDAIRVNASAITLWVFVGEEGERTTLLNLARLVDAGETVAVFRDRFDRQQRTRELADGPRLRFE